jgi:hypothetical protein
MVNKTQFIQTNEVQPFCEILNLLQVYGTIANKGGIEYFTLKYTAFSNEFFCSPFVCDNSVDDCFVLLGSVGV